MAEAYVEYQGLKKRFGSTPILHGIDLKIDEGAFVVLVGPSGCGKSTLLRMTAGLEGITDGDIKIAGRVVNRVHASNRGIAMVFQSYALYPHMSVSDNLAFSLKMRKTPLERITDAIKGAAGILKLSPLLERLPAQLSGGQRQRVAMGRALVREPAVFLFDEPLSNLDAKLRVEMRAEIKALHQRLETTTIYVTHDQIEAMTMADKIVVMNEGLVEQVGGPLELYDHPANQFVAGFIGSPAMNFLAGRIADNGSAMFETESGHQLPLPPQMDPSAKGRRAICGIRPEDMALAENGLPAEVVLIEPTGSEIQVLARTEGQTIVAVFRQRHLFKPGEMISLVPQARSMHLFDAETGARLN